MLVHSVTRNAASHPNNRTKQIAHISVYSARGDHAHTQAHIARAAVGGDRIVAQKFKHRAVKLLYMYKGGWVPNRPNLSEEPRVVRGSQMRPPQAIRHHVNGKVRGEQTSRRAAVSEETYGRCRADLLHLYPVA